MKTNKLLQSFIILGTLSLFFPSCTNKHAIVDSKPKLVYKVDKTSKKGIFSLKQGKNIAISQLVHESEKYPVIFVGDHHNEEKTHQFFNQYLQGLAKKGYKIHLANEWFSPEHNALLKRYTDGKINAEGLKKGRGWDKFTSLRWDLVGNLYETVKKSGGKLYGINLSKKDRKKISKRLFEQMSKEEKRFYDSLDLNVKAHRALVMPFFSHCKQRPQKGNEPCNERMYKVQVAWDTYMGEESAKIAKNIIKTKKDKLIVFAGAMHVAYGLGIPLRFARKSNLPSYIISNHKNGSETLDANIADAVFIYTGK